MSKISAGDDVGLYIRAALEAKVRAIVDDEAERAAERVRDRVRGELAQTTLALFSQYRVDMQRDTLRIEIDLKGAGQ